ncbi:hypothetical protein K1719_000022 [Acacia pycnantha]|nr:hypothetical protein K1719_000022 [Acacia pycnantha]
MLIKTSRPSESSLSILITSQGQGGCGDAALVTKKLLKSTSKAAWISGTTFLILVVPLIIEVDREQQFNELELQKLNSVVVSDALQISIDCARLVLDTLASVLRSESEPLVRVNPEEIESVGADVHDLLLFLYIQSYKKLLPRTHKYSAAVAVVWPSTSAFDGYLSALSPLQLVRSNSLRFMPSQADEEAHQLSYLQKHLANILSLFLAEPMEGEGEESLIILKG